MVGTGLPPFINTETLSYLGPLIALVGGIIGSSIGVLRAALSGVSILSEDLGQFRSVVVLAALPTTQAFYGFIFYFIALNQLAGRPAPAPQTALLYLGLGLFVAVAEALSATYQSQVCIAGISMLPKTGGKIFLGGMILAVYLELFGILAMVFSVMGILLWG